MVDVAIRVEGLGKRYKIGERAPYVTLRDSLADAAGIARRLVTSPKRAQRHSGGGEETFWALRDVTFEVPTGQAIGIMGRNGAGKSTLLKILSRITEPTRGRAEVYGRFGSLLEVGTGFHPELTGRENTYLNRAILGMSRAEIDRKFDEIVAFAEIERFIDTPVKRYSSGMYVRLAFAVAAHLEPDILLVDEVLAVGDAAFQKKCLGTMSEAAKRGRTVLFVSHNLVAVRGLCERALLLDSGRIVQDATPAEVIAFYLGEGRVTNAEAVWEDRANAPGNERVRLHRIRLLDADQTVTSTLQAEHPFEIEIEFWNEKPGSRLGATVVLYDEEGVCVFSSLSNREPAWHERSWPEGLFRSRCRVPGHLLPDGRFYVSLVLWGDGYSWAYTHDYALEFEVAESLERQGDYVGEWLGVVRPSLSWETEYLGASAAPASDGSPAR
ncbi:MAG: ABC transporter ATP-binding protein [Gaiellaceae bacterium]